MPKKKSVTPKAPKIPRRMLPKEEKVLPPRTIEDELKDLDESIEVALGTSEAINREIDRYNQVLKRITFQIPDYKINDDMALCWIPQIKKIGIKVGKGSVHQLNPLALSLRAQVSRYFPQWIDVIKKSFVV